MLRSENESSSRRRKNTTPQRAKLAPGTLPPGGYAGRSFGALREWKELFLILDRVFSTAARN